MRIPCAVLPRLPCAVLAAVLFCAAFSGCGRTAAESSALPDPETTEHEVTTMTIATTVSTTVDPFGTQPDKTAAETNRRTSARMTASTAARHTASSPAQTGKPTQSAATTFKKSERNVERIGRFAADGDGAWLFEWSGSTVTAGFTGMGIGIRLAVVKGGPYGEEDHLNVSVDGGTPFVLTVKKGVTAYRLADGLPNGYHDVRVTKRTEAQFGCQLRFSGFDYGDGEPAPAPARRERRIEIYGDSLSAGYGNEGTRPGFRLPEENADLTYGALTAAALGAEYTTVALSGHGMALSLSGSKTEVLPKYMARALYKDNVAYRFDAPAPQAVIVNLGTNDYAAGVADADYYQAYLTFLSDLRRKYPRAYIVCTTCGGTDKAVDILERVVQVRRDKNKDSRIAHFVGIIEDPDGAFGSDGHPSVYGHRQLAEQLTAFLQEELGW